MTAAPVDTIVAPATPVGRSALAIVRIDGPRSGEIAAVLVNGIELEERRATHVRLAAAGDVIDDCVVTRYAAPRSFTGNDLVELTVHGNPLIVARVIEAAVAHGARIAEPGEFTERAVLNGKLDLVQAESIADLIDARTALQAKLSLDNLGGHLSDRAGALRAALLDVLARLEAALDFSEEGYEFIAREEAETIVRRALDDVRAMAATYRRGRATRQGIELAIIGRPNAGKSTLLNRLVGSERAIVTPIPGTTRDIVRETIEIGGLPVVISDTAGLRETDDAVEGIGVTRARHAAQHADIVLYLVDAAAGLTPTDRAEIEAISGSDVAAGFSPPGTLLTVYTKSDLAQPPSGEIAISAATGAGIDALLARLDDLVRAEFAAPESSAVIVNERQRFAVATTEAAIVAALDALGSGANEELVAADLYRAANALGELIGTISTTEVLDSIFTRFCIGK